MDEQVAAELEEKRKLIKEYEDKLSTLKKEIAKHQTAASFSDEAITKTSTLSIELDGKRRSTMPPVFDKRRSDMPSMAQHTMFQWNDITVSVGKGKDCKQILHDLSGSIVSGELMAIMGPSGIFVLSDNAYFVYTYIFTCAGAGKSTLLNVLSGRTNLSGQQVSGHLSMNGKIIATSEQSVIKSLCCFVPQSDILCSTQTVDEALLFYAKLKLSNKTLQKQIKRINYLVKALSLTECRQNMIGDMNESSSRKGISGGERRRVSIASEIINDVDLIFLDEPTSGLDSFTAAATIKTLKAFCSVSNKIIIATIHQPSIETFHLFDQLILLSHGKCCFNGAIKDIQIFFKDALRPKTNPADVILAEIQQKPEEYALKWKDSALNDPDGVIGRTDTTPKIFTNDDLKNAANNLQRASIFTQIILLLKREFKAMYRDRRVTLMRFVQVLFFALVCGFLYFQVPYSYNQRGRAFFFLAFMPLLFGMIILLVAFPKQKALFQREYNSNTYSAVSFMISTVMIEFPREVIHMSIFNAIAYPMMGVEGKWLFYWVNLFLCSLSGGSIGMFFGVISESTAEAAQMVPAALIPILIFSGALTPLETIPKAVRWMCWLNPLYYLFRCFAIIEFDGTAYERNLSEDDQYLCDAYKNGTLAQFAKYYEPYVSNVTNSTHCDCSNYNETDDFDYSVDVPVTTQVPIPEVEADTTPASFNASALTDERIDTYCRAEIPAEFVFKQMNLDPSSLLMYWGIVFAICIFVRLLTMFLLYAISNDGFSWFKNIMKEKMEKMLCCCSKQEKGKEKVRTKKQNKCTASPVFQGIALKEIGTVKGMERIQSGVEEE